MKKVGPQTLQRFRGRILNTPRTGATVHIVTEDYA
jgi:folate-dependent phosphoribosylglycinamide formyltransferase PurN